MGAAQFLFGHGDGAANSALWAMYAGVGVTLGHNFPFYLHFRGGKGIACLAGILSTMDLRIMVSCMLVVRSGGGDYQIRIVRLYPGFACVLGRTDFFLEARAAIR